jgi:hypothetical protein
MLVWGHTPFLVYSYLTFGVKGRVRSKEQRSQNEEKKLLFWSNFWISYKRNPGEEKK